MNDLIFNYLKDRTISADDLSDAQISKLASLSSRFHLIGFITSTYKFSASTRYKELNSIRDLSIAKNLLMIHDLKLICSNFNKNKINYCILKGPALNIAEAYDPAIRFFKDLDILVEKKDLEFAFKILINLGFKYLNKHTKNSCNFIGDHHLPIMSNPNNTFVELHHRVTSKKHYEECPITDNILKEKIYHKEVFIPCPDALIAHILYHGLIQHVYSIGPVVLFDIKEIMKKFNLKEHVNNKYISLLGIKKEFTNVKELLIEIKNKDEIKDFDQRLDNIRQNLSLKHEEGKIHIFNLKQIFIKFSENISEVVARTEFKYQTPRTSIKFPFLYLNELFRLIRSNIKLF